MKVAGVQGVGDAAPRLTVTPSVVVMSLARLFSSLRSSAAVIAAATLMLAGCGRGEDAPPPLAAGSATIGVDGGTVAALDGATLTIPTGALGEQATFGLGADGSDAPPLPPQVRAIGSMWSATPHGALFATDARVRIPFDASALLPGEEPVLLKGDPQGGWTVLRDVTVEGGFITAPVRSLSFFVPAGSPAGGLSVPPNPPATQASFALNLLNDDWVSLTPTGANVLIRQQRDPAEPARLQVRYTIPATAAVLASCPPPQALGIRLVYTPVQFYALSGQAGENRILLDPGNDALQPLDQQIEGAELGRLTELEIPVNVVDHPFNRSASFQPRPALPPGAQGAGSGVQIELQLECHGSGAIVTLPTAVVPIVVARGFAESPVDFVEHPWPLAGLVGQQVKSDFRVQFDLGTWFALPDQGDVVWESAPAGSTAFAPLPVGGTSIDADGNLGAATRGYFGAPGFVVGRGTLADNGRLVRLTYCVRKRSDETDRRCTTSRAAPISVVTQLAAPAFTLQPRSRTHQPGESLDMMAAYEGLPTPQRVTWQVRTQPGVPWEDAATRGFYVQNEAGSPADLRGRTRLLSRSPLALGQAFQFRATYTTNAGTAVSNIANVTVATGQAAPTILVEPLDVQVAAGDAFSLVSAASGGFPLTFQWTRDGVALRGANGQVLTLTGASAAIAGQYRLEVRNSAGRVQSRQAQVSLVPTAPTGPQPPFILSPPQGTSAAAGTTVSFSVGLASNNLTPSYQWLRNGTAIAGATGATLTLSAITASDQADYAVRVSNTAPSGSVTSLAARLTVTEAPVGAVAPSINSAPTGLTLLAGQTARFSVAATGSAPLAYQWQRDGFDVPGANAAVLALPSVGTAEVGAYRVIVSNGAGSTTSAPAGLALAPSDFTVVGPTAARVQLGENARFTATVVASPAPTCQWLRAGNAIPAATSCTGYTTGASNAGDNGAVFALSATSGGRTVTSSGAVLTVVADIVPTLVQSPTDQTTVIGGSATFSALATGSPTPLYRWSLNGSRIAEALAPGGGAAPFTIGNCTGTVRLGAGGASITLSSLAVVCAGASVTVLASNAAGSSEPAGATLRLSNAPAPAFSAVPMSQTVVAGNNVSFTAVATSATGNTVFYEWEIDGVRALPSMTLRANCFTTRGLEATGGTLSLRGIGPGCNGAVITVRAVDRSAGLSVAASATLTVTPGPGPTVTLSPATASTVAGNNLNVRFDATAPNEAGNQIVTFNWRLNGASILAGEDIQGPFNVNGCSGYGIAFPGDVDGSVIFSTLHVLAVSEGCDGAVFSVSAEDRFGTSGESRATIFVAPALVAPAITEAPQAKTTTEGGSTSFTGTASGNPAPTLQWLLTTAGGAEGAVSTGSFSVGPAPACTGFATVMQSADRSTLLLSQVSRGCNGASLRLRASNSQGSAASAAAAFTVNPAGTAPQITAQPAAASTTVGGSANFSVSATGSGTLSYAWTLNNSPLPGSGTFTVGLCTGSLVSSNGGANIALAGLAAGCNGAAISVTVSNGVNPNAVSNTVTITVNQAATPGACFGGPSGWCYANPQPQAGGLTGLVYTASTSTFTAVGEAGTTVRTGDSGASWQVAFEAGRTSFTDLASPAPGVLVAAGAPPLGSPKGSGVFRSTDGGQTWSQRLDAGSPGQLAVTKLAFADASVGVAAGPLGVWRTVDGGLSWTQVNAPAAQFVVFSDFGGVAWADTNVVLIYGGFGKILRSADSGVTWADVSPAGFFDNWRDMAFNATGVGVAVGPNGKVGRSTDGGASWQGVNTPMTEPGTAAAFANGSTVVVMGNLFGAMRSTDAGATWTAGSGFFGASSQFRLRFASSTVGLAVSAIGGLTLRTDNGGATWTRVGGGTLDEKVIGMAASPSGTVVLAGSVERDLLRSADGGATWARPPGFTVYGLRFQKPSFATEQRVIAMRPAGQIALSNDAGQTWNITYDQPGQVVLADTTMASATIGLVVGNNGLILRSDNGGSSWTAVASGTMLPLKSVGCLTATVCLAGGSVFLRSTDAGATWSVAPFPVSGFSQIRAIARVSNTTAVLAADDGLWRSADAGQTWTRVYTPTGGSQLGVSFNAAGIGIATGYDGVLRSIDQGLTWVAQPVPAPSYLNAVTWVTPMTVLVGGDGGAILRNLQAGAP